MKKILIGLMCAAMLCAGGCSMERKEIMNSAAVESRLTVEETNESVLSDASQEDDAEETVEKDKGIFDDENDVKIFDNEDEEDISDYEPLDYTVENADGDYAMLNSYEYEGEPYNFSEISIDDYLDKYRNTNYADTPLSLMLSNGEFMTTKLYRDKVLTFIGFFELDDEKKLQFTYNRYMGDYYNNEDLEIDIDSKNNGLRERDTVSLMTKMNEKGTFIFDVGSACPDVYNNEKLPEARILTLPVFNINEISSFESLSYMLNKASPPDLIAKANFLCRNTHGVELKGRYRYGKNFQLNYNFFDCFMNEELSAYNLLSEEDREKKLNGMAECYAHAIDISWEDMDDFDTTIKFGNGEWEWLDKNGNLINKGGYQESSQYKGLIVMYATEDSKVDHRILMEQQRFFFLITDDGIYQPAFIKTE